MQEIIKPVDKGLIKKELSSERFVRYTNNGSNEVYLVNFHNAPNVVKEIGRLREITFRGAGGGTGLPIDLDENDTNENCYQQLIAWNPEDEEIIAGYRFINCNHVIGEGKDLDLSTAHYFSFSKKFTQDYLPYTLELGRSFVQPRYQPAVDNRKGLFSLDNLWDGLGALVMLYPDIKYLFGKVTMYTHYNAEARDLLMLFMEHYFFDSENLVKPIKPVGFKTDITKYKGIFEGKPYKEGYKLLNGKIRELGENIPPLVNTYMNLSPTMRAFGTTLNEEFGEVEETGILITLEDVFPSKKDRHMNTFERDRNYDSPAQK